MMIKNYVEPDEILEDFSTLVDRGIYTLRLVTEKKYFGGRDNGRHYVPSGYACKSQVFLEEVKTKKNRGVCKTNKVVLEKKLALYQKNRDVTNTNGHCKESCTQCHSDLITIVQSGQEWVPKNIKGKIQSTANKHRKIELRKNGGNGYESYDSSP